MAVTRKCVFFSSIITRGCKMNERRRIKRRRRTRESGGCT
jgi:hypothetical protein